MDQGMPRDSLTITGIGSRKTPESILREMVQIGEWARENDCWVRSGHAEGADWAFEQGAQEKCVAYLPWGSFNKQLESRAVKIVFERLPEKVRSRALETLSYHPRPDTLSPAVKKLMARDAMQVLGTLLRLPSDVVVFWTAGQLQAVRIATAYHVPLINMGLSQLSTAKQVIAELEKLKERKNGTK